MDVVTGAFSFTGRYVAARLLALGRDVRTLTSRPAEQSPFGRLVEGRPLDFGDETALARSLEGAETLYNTYWIRFPRGEMGFEQAVANTRTLLRAAGRAGVGRVVQLSVTNAAAHSPFPYFRGKAAAEAELRASGLSYAIVRPTLLFARGEVLVNNIAWLLRRLPLFVVPGSGRYAVQPVAAEDVAEICVAAAAREENVVVDATGPDVVAFADLVALARRAVGSRALIRYGSPRLALALSRPFGLAAGGALVTPDELQALMASLLVSAEPPVGTRRFADWLTASADQLGRRLASDLSRPWA